MPKKREKQPENPVVGDDSGKIPLESLLERGIKGMSVEIVNLANAIILEGTGDGVMVDKETLVMSYPEGTKIRFRAIDESCREIIQEGTVKGLIPPLLHRNPVTGEVTIQREACLDVVTDDGIHIHHYGVDLQAIIPQNQA